MTRLTRVAAACAGLALAPCAPIAASAQTPIGIGVSSTTVSTDCAPQPKVHADSSELRIRVRFADTTIADAEATVTIADSLDRRIAERRFARGQRTWSVMGPARAVRVRVASATLIGTGADVVLKGGCRVSVQVGLWRK